jgi:hypothetical protein
MSTATEVRQRVLVRIICRSCRQSCELCVSVEITVPEPLRCSPSGAPAAGIGSRRGLTCPHCQCPFDMTDAELRRRVEDELRRGRGRHVRAGAVVIDCR